MSQDLDLGALHAASAQSKAAMVEMADNLGGFYDRLCAYMPEAHAFELTNTVVIESMAREDGDE